MGENPEPGIGNGGAEESASNGSRATAESSTPSLQKRRKDTQKTSPVEALEIFQSAFNDLQSAGIPAQALKSKDNQVLVYRVGARQCLTCRQPRPLWYFNMDGVCKECRP